MPHDGLRGPPAWPSLPAGCRSHRPGWTDGHPHAEHRTDGLVTSGLCVCLDILPGRQGQAIDDPWYTHKFELTYQELAAAIPAWLQALAH